MKLRAPTDEERRELERLAHVQTAPARLVECARVVVATLAGERAEAIAARVPVTVATVYLWLHRFNKRGIAGVEDRRRKGRPPTYTREQVGEIVATTLSDPQTLGLPFHSWTLDRLPT